MIQSGHSMSARSSASSSAMSLEEYIILPASHSQQDFAEERKMVPMLRVNRNLSFGAKWYLIIAHVIGNIDDRHRTASRRPCFRFDERWRSRQLPSRDCRHYGAYLGLEYATWDSVESDLRIVACIDPLQ